MDVWLIWQINCLP